MGIVEDDHKDKNSESFSNVNRPEFLLFSQKRRFRLLVKDGWQIMSEYKCCFETNLRRLQTIKIQDMNVFIYSS